MSLGTGGHSNIQSYKTASKWSATFGQTKDYIGLAERQAVRTQIKYAQTVRAINDRFDFCRVDVQIPKKLDILNGYKYAKEYLSIGNQLATIYINNGGLNNIPSIIMNNKQNYNEAVWLLEEHRKYAYKAKAISDRLEELKP